MVDFRCKFLTWAQNLMPLGFLVTWYFIDKQQKKKPTVFKHNIALFRRPLKPGETETWK